jgi:SPP1 family predicted phage head-tail adaptor
LIRAGTMRDLISLLEPAPTTDVRWGTTPGWSQFATAWASVTPTDGTEMFTANGVQSVVTHTIKMRYRPDVDSTDRIGYRGQMLEILSCIDPDGRQRELLIAAKLYPGVQ